MKLSSLSSALLLFLALYAESLVANFFVNKLHAEGYLRPKQGTKAFHVAAHHLPIDFFSLLFRHNRRPLIPADDIVALGQECPIAPQPPSANTQPRTSTIVTFLKQGLPFAMPEARWSVGGTPVGPITKTLKAGQVF